MAATLACLVCMCVCVAEPEGESAAGCAQGRQVRVGYGSRGKGERVAELSAVTAAAAGVERRGGARGGGGGEGGAHFQPCRSSVTQPLSPFSRKS